MAFTTIPVAGARLRASVLSSLITEVRPLHAIKSGDETVTSSTALQNDDALSFAVAANTRYEFVVGGRYDAIALADFKLGWTLPSGATMRYVAQGIASGGTAYNLFDQDQSSTPTFEGAGAGTIRNYTMIGWIETSSTAGTAQLQFAQGTSNGTGSIHKAGSWLTARKVT